MAKRTVKSCGLAFEDIIETLGSFGHWQRVIFVLISSADIFGAMCMMLPVFIGDVPRWRCARFENRNATWWSPTENDTTIPDLEVCERNGTKCIEFQFIDDFTSFIGEWSLVCGKNFFSDVISSIQMAGLFVGAAVFGQLTDTFGRKRMYYLAFAIEIGSGVVSAASVNWQMYAFCRFIVGVGFGSYMVINCVYPMEFIGQKWRTLCGTIGFWAIGIMMLAGIAYLVRDWRYLTGATTVSGVLFFLTWFWVPESPRWLVQQRRFDEAQDILKVIADRNHRPPPSVDVLKQFAEEDAAQAAELKKYSYLDLFRRRKYTVQTLALALLWFTAFLVYYEISFNLKNLSGNRYLNMFYGGGIDLAAMISVLLILNRIGRRLSLIVFLGVTVTSLLSIVFIIVAGKDKEFPGAILGLALIGKSSGLASTYNVQIMSAEVFPTIIRSVGLGSGAIAGRIGGTLAPLLVYLGSLYQLAPYIMVLILAVLSLPAVFLLPETNGEPLEDTYDNPVAPLLAHGVTTKDERKNDLVKSNPDADVTRI